MKPLLIYGPLVFFGCSSPSALPKPHEAAAPPVVAETATADSEPHTGGQAAPEAREPEEQAAATELVRTRDVPDACSSEGCLPPDAFAQSLCKGKYPGLALVMFEKHTPWTRKWVNLERLEAVNAFGGPSTGGDLVFAEEVLLLRRQSAAAGGVQVSGSEDVDVLRWNGTCVTVRESELVEYVPGLPKHAPIVWNYLDEQMREALLVNGTVRQTKSRRQQECRGSSKRNPTGSCKKADDALNDAIVIAVRRGIELPLPEKRPEWVDPNSNAGLARAGSGQ